MDLDLDARLRIAQEVRQLVDARALGAATRTIEALVGRWDEEVARAAATVADLDWVEVCAEVVEADASLRAAGDVGCRLVTLALGNQPENRLDVRRDYHGTAPSPGAPPTEGARTGPGGRGPSGRLSVTGLDALAAIQLRHPPQDRDYRADHARAVWLAGHLLVLRFLGAVRRRAATTGLPVPARVRATVEAVTGDEAYQQLGPSLTLEIPCAVRPIDADVEARLAERHGMRTAEWSAATHALLRSLHQHFDAHGSVPTRLLPDELGEEKRRLQEIEADLQIRRLPNRIGRPEFEALLLRIRAVRERTEPKAIDLAMYR